MKTDPLAESCNCSQQGVHPVYPAHWHQEQLQGGQMKVKAKMRLSVQKQESHGPGVSRLRLI